MSSTADDSVKSRLVEVSDQLQIPSDTLQITLVRLDQLRSQPDVDTENLDDTAAAALALSAREDGLPVSEKDIASAWASTLSTDTSLTISQQQLEAVSSYIEMDEVPPHPKALVRSFAEAVEMPNALVEVANRLLDDAFGEDPTVVAGGPSPAATAGAVLSLAALINGRGDAYGQDTLGKASGAGEVTVQNRRRDLESLLGESRLQTDRYQVQPSQKSDASASRSSGSSSSSSSSTSTSSSSSTESTAADGAGTEETSGGSTASQGSLSADAVESEIDSLVEDLDIGPSTRLLARGMVSDAVKQMDGGDAAELAATMVVAASRMEEGDVDAVDVADGRSFQPRAVSQSLDTLSETVDVDIPRRGTGDIVADLVAQLDLPDTVREESLTALERYDTDEADAEYTTAELAAGAVLFAATVGRTQVSLDDLAAVSGGDPEYISSAMNSVVVSQCLGLVRGDIDYENCAWTTDLLESELSPNIGDAYTGRVIAIAQTYTAGREGRHIDDSTLDVVFADD